MPGRSDYYRMMIQYRVMRKEEIRDQLIASAQAQSDPELLWNDLEAEQKRLLQMEQQFGMYERSVLSGQKSAGTSGMGVVAHMVKPMTISGGGGSTRSAEADIDRQNQRLNTQQKAFIQNIFDDEVNADLVDAWVEGGYGVAFANAPSEPTRRQVLRNLSDTWATANSISPEEADEAVVNTLGGNHKLTAAQFSNATMDAFKSEKPTGSWKSSRPTMSGAAASQMASAATGEQFGYLAGEETKLARKQEEIDAQRERVSGLREQIRTAKPADIDLADIERRAAIEYTEAYGTPRGKRLLGRERQRIGREREFEALPEDIRSEVEDDPRLERVQRRLERSGREGVSEGRLLDLDAAKAPQTAPVPEGPALGGDPTVLQSLSVAKVGQEASPIQLVSGDQFRTIEGQSKPTSEITGLDLAKWSLAQSFGANEAALTDDQELDASRLLVQYVGSVKPDSPDASIIMARLGEYITMDVPPPPSQMMEGLRKATDDADAAYTRTLTEREQAAAQAPAAPLVFSQEEDPMVITAGGILDPAQWKKDLEQLKGAPAPEQAAERHRMLREAGKSVASERWFEGQKDSPLNPGDVEDKILEAVGATSKVKKSIKAHGEQVAALALLAAKRAQNGGAVPASDYGPQLKRIFEEDWESQDIRDAATALYTAFLDLAKANP